MPVDTEASSMPVVTSRAASTMYSPLALAVSLAWSRVLLTTAASGCGNFDERNVAA
eukprot:CAMPEP_0185911990 /NCGR_PEP_ID=MMETSP0196C-20130402/35559_1 /TAXON_ID=2932 /ORGANISM="Alexandrium fundyense, Strain CCMP1719" /LENGTH=55 /DNA_ID=CAMNT_0028633141 /DNA_START=124 /DNA_END=288 /DNA_ORIENTATION=-